MHDPRFIYKCTDCGKEFSTSEVMYLCPACSRQNTANAPLFGVLGILYDYDHIKKTTPEFDDLKRNNFASLLPIRNIENLPSLRVGNTPLYSSVRPDGKPLPFRVHLKDDSQNPTWSFKDRASALVSAYAMENKLDTIVTASTGNAGSSIAGICASQNQKAVVIVPEKAPVAKLTQIIMYGATIVPIKGTYDEAFDLSIKATGEFGWYNRNTAYNPLTVEGKKTVSFEIFEQLQFKVPERIFVPVGDGVIIAAVYKGFEDLLKLNMFDSMPVVVAVQAEGSDNLVRNLNSEYFRIIQSVTVADSISVDVPRNFHMARKFIHKYEGEAITVSDEEIIAASSVLSKSTGLFAEPAGAAAFAGLLSYIQDGKIGDDSDNVVLLTGSGLKDLKPLTTKLSIPQAVDPSIENLKKLRI
jgi:threonine synthase